MGRSSYNGGSTIIKTGAFVTSVNRTIKQVENNLLALEQGEKTGKKKHVFNTCRSLKKELPKLITSKKGVLYLKSIIYRLSETGYFNKDFIEELYNSMDNVSSEVSTKND
tara:strand:+ start:57 stop:386 length:330 start_codon:yes stop_codon:yes gene_type:complete